MEARAESDVSRNEAVAVMRGGYALGADVLMSLPPAKREIL